MKTLFEIIPSPFYAEDCALICEVNYEGFSCAIKREKDQEYIGVAVYQFEKSTPRAGFPIALQLLFNSKEFLSQRYKRVATTFSVKESVLIPLALYNSRNNESALNLIHGDLHHGQTLLTDAITELGFYNTFRVNDTVYQTITNQFPESSMWHHYSVLISRQAQPVQKLFIIFYSNKMVVTLFLEGKCHLVNTYDFQSAEDVSYTLLNICQQFHLEDIELEVSGFIEKDSSLYQELYKYFSQISFSELPQLCKFSDAILAYPAHYFSHLFALDVCG